MMGSRKLYFTMDKFKISKSIGRCTGSQLQAARGTRDPHVSKIEHQYLNAAFVALVLHLAATVAV